MCVVYAGSTPAQSTLFLSFIITLIVLLNSITAVGQNDVWCNGSTTDFGSVSGGSSPPTLTNTACCNKPKVRKCTIR